MSDFVNNFWSLYIAVLTAVSLVACVALLVAMRSKRKTPGAKPELHGHVWDEDLAEFNNPLPRWWTGLFYVTIVFGVVYLVLYPASAATPVCLHGRRAANTRPKPRLPKVVMARPSIDTWGKGWKLSPRIPKRAQSVNGCF